MSTTHLIKEKKSQLPSITRCTLVEISLLCMRAKESETYNLMFLLCYKIRIYRISMINDCMDRGDGALYWHFFRAEETSLHKFEILSNIYLHSKMSLESFLTFVPQISQRFISEKSFKFKCIIKRIYFQLFPLSLTQLRHIFVIFLTYTHAFLYLCLRTLRWY